MVDAASCIEFITDEAELRALAQDWDELWARVDGEHHESFDVAWLSWLEVAKPKGRQLRCLVWREHGQLLMVWPMTVHTTMRCTVLRPLGPGTADYTVVLMPQRADRRALLETAWRAHLRFSRPDLSFLPYLAEHSDLQTVAAGQRHIVQADTDRSALVRLSQEDDWASFCRKVGALDGRKPGVLARRLSKEGQLELRIVGGPADDANEIEMLVDWTLASKRTWAAHAGVHGPWLSSPLYRDYLVRLLVPGDRPVRAWLFLITLDGVAIATSIVGLGKSCVVGLMNGFDPARARFGPGKLSLEYVLKWAYEQRLDLDFGVGFQKYKGYWSQERWVRLHSYEYANTRWGWTARRAKESVLELKSRLSQLRTRTKGGRAVEAEAAEHVESSAPPPP